MNLVRAVKQKRHLEAFRHLIRRLLRSWFAAVGLGEAGRLAGGRHGGSRTAGDGPGADPGQVARQLDTRLSSAAKPDSVRTDQGPKEKRPQARQQGSYSTSHHSSRLPHPALVFNTDQLDTLRE